MQQACQQSENQRLRYNDYLRSVNRQLDAYRSAISDSNRAAENVNSLRSQLNSLSEKANEASRVANEARQHLHSAENQYRQASNQETNAANKANHMASQVQQLKKRAASCGVAIRQAADTDLSVDSDATPTVAMIQAIGSAAIQLLLAKSCAR